MTELYGYGEELLESLPEYYHRDDFMQQYFMAFGFEFEKLQRLTTFITIEDALAALNNNLLNELENIIAQWFARTAGETGLALWEQFLGLSTDTSMPRSERVAGLLTKMKVAQAPTPEYIRQQLLQYVVDLEIRERFDLPGNDKNRLRFEIRILEPKGFPPNVQENIELMIQRIKPAHLGYIIIWSEPTWATTGGNLGDSTWADVGEMTWADFAF